MQNFIKCTVQLKVISNFMQQHLNFLFPFSIDTRHIVFKYIFDTNQNISEPSDTIGVLITISK